MVNRSQEFSNFNEIDNFFKSYDSTGFVDWFNRYVSIPSNSMWYNEKGQSIKISKQINWQKLWNNIPVIYDRDKINLLEFLALNTIIVNETGGLFLPKSEGIGSSGHPGIAYLFDDLKKNKGDIVNKVSYNQNYPGNKDAYTLFNDPIYKKAHQNEPLSFLKDTTNTAWQGDHFPAGSITGNISNETDPKGITNTFLTSADFTKFRGRGFIQTTGRSNYKPIIKFILDYTGNNITILNIKNQWKIWGTDLENIASASTNSQWDMLFQNTDLIIACYSISNLSKYIGFDHINPNLSDANLQKKFLSIGKKESGGTGYAEKYLQRILVQLDILDKKGPDLIANSSATQPIQQVASEEPGRSERTGQDLDSGKSDKDITGSIPTIRNLFQASSKPGAISFGTNGEI